MKRSNSGSPALSNDCPSVGSDKKSPSTAASNPPSSCSSQKKHLPKRLKFSMNASESASELEIQKMDINNPDNAKRIQNRLRQVMFGKNTVGYDEYVKQVPKERRRARSMKTPSTPDHTLDVPNKRWAGMVRAWRRSLHEYDPADLQKDTSSESSPPDARRDIFSQKEAPVTHATDETMDAEPSQQQASLSKTKQHSSPVSVLNEHSDRLVGDSAMAELDDLDSRRQNKPAFDWAEIDSDDELI